MKTSPLVSALVLAFATLAGPRDAAAAAPTAVPAHKITSTERIALDLVKNQVADAELDAALQQRGIGPGRKHDELVALAKAMRALVADGVVAESEAFWAFLAEGGPAPGGNGGGKPAPAGETVTQLWRRGLAKLADVPRDRRDVFLDYNLLDQTEDTAGWTDENQKALQAESVPGARKKTGTVKPLSKVTFAELNQRMKPSFADADATVTANTPARNPEEQHTKDVLRADKLLVRLGYNAVLENSKAGGASPSEEEKKAVSTFGLAAVDTPPALDPDARLRNAGISIATGAGIMRATTRDAAGVATRDNRTISAVLARWNLIQRKATAKWNQKIGQRNSDGYTLMTYYGRVEYAVRGYVPREKPYPRSLEQTGFIYDVLANFTFFGPFIGTAGMGEDMPKPGSTTGQKERPYLLGMSAGLGFFDQASSLLYLDVGKTVSPTRGFKDSGLYYGFSCDAVVFRKLFESTRKAGSDLKL